jgi:phosphoribosylamine--glycine ligase
VSLAAADEAAVTIVVTAGGYPAGIDSGSPIEGVEAAQEAGALVFHAGTALRDGRLVTNGGRILDVTCVGGSIAEARERAYAAAELISFPGARFRHDIAAVAAQREARVGG